MTTEFTMRIKRTMLVGLGSVALTLALLATPSWAQEPEEAQGLVIAGNSQETTNSPENVSVGTAELTIDGVTRSATTLSTPISVEALTDNFGMFVGTTSRVFDFGNGDTLSTVDQVLLLATQPGWFSVHTVMTVTGGTGVFANALGQIDGYGVTQVDGASTSAMMSLEGRLLI